MGQFLLTRSSLMEVLLTVLLLISPAIFWFIKKVFSQPGGLYRGKRYRYYGRRVANGVTPKDLDGKAYPEVYLFGAYKAIHCGREMWHPEIHTFRCRAFNNPNNPDDTFSVHRDELPLWVSFQREVGIEGDLS